MFFPVIVGYSPAILHFSIFLRVRVCTCVHTRTRVHSVLVLEITPTAPHFSSSQGLSIQPRACHVTCLTSQLVPAF